MKLAWKQFNALGTDIVVTAYLKPHENYLLDRAQAQFIEFEQRFSRFITTSELNTLNNFAGGEYRASEMLIDLLSRCQYYYRETKGLFNPEIIDLLEGVGYDRNFVDINNTQLTHETALQKRLDSKRVYEARPQFSDLEIKGDILKVPKGFRVDLGGIGKGYVVDLVGREIFSEVKNYWISAGGDLLASGNDGEKNGWRISVQNPNDVTKESFSFNTLGNKLGIATSGIIKRQGIAGGLEWNHIINPESATPADNNIISVSIIAPTAEQADVYAKIVLLMGSEVGMKFIEEQANLEGAIYLKNKSAIFSSGLVKYL